MHGSTAALLPGLQARGASPTGSMHCPDAVFWRFAGSAVCAYSSMGARSYQLRAQPPCLCSKATSAMRVFCNLTGLAQQASIRAYLWSLANIQSRYSCQHSENLDELTLQKGPDALYILQTHRKHTTAGVPGSRRQAMLWSPLKGSEHHTQYGVCTCAHLII